MPDTSESRTSLAGDTSESTTSLAGVTVSVTAGTKLNDEINLPLNRAEGAT